ncbi:MAG: redox-sensing transcriptional repressor Rex [Candidatus Hydrogenedentes bacterium]|nr:redox-sensing transcriptional repressor Rex [Candidatus Hydrogenedentota bacterium]
MGVSERVVGRLILYRRLLKDLADEGAGYVFSHELAARAKSTAAQVRRDLMVLGYMGSPARGYAVRDLIAALSVFLDAPERQKVALVGVGNLGRALLAYFVGRHPQFTIAVAFDADPQKVGRVVNGCPIHAMDSLGQVARQEGIDLAIIAVPAPEAQAVAAELYKAGIRGILNFAPVRLWAPEGVYVEHLDMTMSLGRVAYFGRR